MRRRQPSALAARDDAAWLTARRAFCVFAFGMTGYFLFVLAWVMLHPVA